MSDLLSDAVSNPAPPKLVAGAPCLDFVNTASAWLTDYSSFLRWLELAGLLNKDESRVLAREALRNPEAAAEVLADAATLRTALDALFRGSETAEVRALKTVNDLLLRAPARDALARREGRLGWRPARAGEPLEAPLWPLLWDAADLATSPRAVRVRACADTGCAWLFLDLSRNRSRRWCSMEDCGNRAKARRHYARKKRKISPT